MVGFALAQSDPGFITGQIPTADQWNTYFDSKWDYPGNIAPTLVMAGPASGPSAPAAFRALGVADVPQITTLQKAVYAPAGTVINGAHVVIGITAALSGASIPVTLSGNAEFTSASTYTCSANDTAGASANVVSAANTSGTQFVLYGTIGHAYNYICVGT
jgi:hypothetical protein